MSYVKMSEIDIDSEKFDIVSNQSSKEIKVTYVILSGQRTGSYLLCRQLINAQLGIPTEYFNTSNMDRICRRIGIPTTDLSRYIQFLQENRVTSNGVFAIKLQPFQYMSFPSLFDRYLFNHTLNLNTKYLFLFRSNLLKQAVSLHLAQITGKWNTISPMMIKKLNQHGQIGDLKDIKQCVKAVIAQNQVVLTLIAKKKIDVFPIQYETYVHEQENKLAQFAQYLGISDYQHVSAEINELDAHSQKIKQQLVDAFIDQYGHTDIFDISDICNWKPEQYSITDQANLEQEDLDRKRASTLNLELPIKSTLKMLQVCVLNLKRRPDRRTQFLKLNSHANLHFNWIEAIDGRDLNRSRLIEMNLVTRRHQHFNPGQLGCALSHKFLWQRCVEQGKLLLVCEDDAILRQDFATAFTNLYQQLPDHWDFVLLGYNFNSIVDVEMIPGIDLQANFSPSVISKTDQHAFVKMTGMSMLFPLNNAFGTCAYAVSPKGAKQLISLCFPLAGVAVAVPALKRVLQPASHIDVIMNTHYRRLQAFCSIPPLVITLNNPQDSDTVL